MRMGSASLVSLGLSKYMGDNLCPQRDKNHLFGVEIVPRGTNTCPKSKFVLRKERRSEGGFLIR
jgi:hypothetical protein